MCQAYTEVSSHQKSNNDLEDLKFNLQGSLDKQEAVVPVGPPGPNVQLSYPRHVRK